MNSGQHSPTVDALIGRRARPFGRVSAAFLLRIMLLLLALAVAGVYSFNRVMRPASLQGVVNAPIVTLRAPIDGQMVRGGLVIGQAIAPGTELFAVRDHRVDLHRQHDLRTRLAAAEQRVTAIDQALTDLDLMVVELRDRVSAYLAAEVGRLLVTINGQTVTIANARQTLTFTRQREEHIRRLLKVGTSVQLRYEGATRERLGAQLTLDRTIAEREANLAALGAARQQIFLQTGAGGSAYAQQKLDELQVRRLEQRYQRSVSLSEIASLRAELEAETTHVDALREVTVPASVKGVVAAVYVSPGTEVLRGNALADILDCSSLYVEATVSTGWLTAPRAGDRVHVGIYGNGATVEGRIRIMRDTAMALDPSRSIPLSDRDNRQTLTAIIDLDPKALAASGSGGCPVGQPVSVRFR